MQITWLSYVIICPALFLTGMINAIGGGGALISLPAYMLAGLPAHGAVATNKLSSTCGSTVSTFRFIKERLIDFKLAVPSVIAAIISSALGAQVSLAIPEKVLAEAMVVILPFVAIVVLRPAFLKEEDNCVLQYDIKTFFTCIVAATIVGFYDGIYGPGTGTFLIIAFRVFTSMNLKQANGQAKIINWTTDVSALIVFLIKQSVVFSIGIPAAICNMAGSYVGAKMAIKNGGKIIKPCIIIMLILLLIKIVVDNFM